mgnify:CR=1 FL=1
MNNINENNINNLEDMKKAVGRIEELSKEYKELTKRVKKSEGVFHEDVFLSQQKGRNKRNTDNASEGINLPYEKEFIFSTGSSTYTEWLKNEYERTDRVANSKNLQKLFSDYIDMQLNSLEKEQRIIIFMDVDDVMLNSLETVIEIINEDLEDNLIFVEDVKTWDFQVILRKIAKSNNPNKHLYTTKQDIINIFDEDERFQERIRLKEEWLDFFDNKDNHDKFGILFFTQGSVNNNNFKFDFLSKVLGIDFTYSFNLSEDRESAEENFESQIPCNFLGISNTQIKTDFLQSTKSLKNVIQIDDNYKNLKNSKCGFKILLTNERETEFNQIADNNTHTYRANNVSEIIELLNFISKNKEFLDTEYSG